MSDAVEKAGRRIGRPVNDWQLRVVDAKDSITKTGYVNLFNGRVNIDVYGVGADGFVPMGELIGQAEKVRQEGTGLFELVARAEAVMPVRFEVSRDTYGNLYLRGYTRTEGVRVYDQRYEDENSSPAEKLQAAEAFLRDLIGVGACLPPA